MKVQGFTAAVACSLAVFAGACFLSAGQALPAGAAAQSKAESPVVKITAPDNNSAWPWNSLVSYSVVVTWQGKSTQYQEIPSSDVLIRTTYVPDVSKSGCAADPLPPPPAGLLHLTRSNCVGCHAFRARATGPSFAAIAARYPDNSTSIDTLARYIREGSTGLWGPVSMPPHPEMTADEARAMAQWIVKDAADPNVNYYVGTEGAIRMEAPASPSAAGGIIVTASYTAPAAAADPTQAPRGEDTIILRGR